MRSHRLILLLGALAAAQLAVSFGYTAHAQAPLPSVVVSSVAERDVSPRFNFVGRVEAVQRVALRARVEGFLEARRFEEGRDVGRGEILFRIEHAPYEIAVQQRSAELAGARGTLKNAQADLSRQRDLRARGMTAAADVDAAVATATTAEAAVMLAQAALARAQLDLSYTQVVSPIDGRIGRARYTVGNLVGPSSEPLAVVTSLNPIYVLINVPERALLAARSNYRRQEGASVRPVLTLSDGTPYPHDGDFDFLDSEVNASTDTLVVRAVFPNPDGVLIPGQIVNVDVQLKNPRLLPAVPQAAVQADRTGRFVLVVNETDQIEQRRVEVGEMVDGVWAVTEGLTVGERVVVQGLQKVRPGMRVQAVPEPAPERR